MWEYRSVKAHAVIMRTRHEIDAAKLSVQDMLMDTPQPMIIKKIDVLSISLFCDFFLSFVEWYKNDERNVHPENPVIITEAVLNFSGTSLSNRKITPNTIDKMAHAR